jgi:hypothetical protein
MASTYSNIKIQLMATGENNTTWGNVTNTNLGTALEEAIVGSADVTFASANVTLTLTDTNATQAARHVRLRCTGTTGGSTRNLVVPSIEKPYIVQNDCADSIVVKTAAGTGITVPAGKTMWVYNDGVNVVDAVNHLTTLTLGTALPVLSGGTGSNTAGGARTNLGATTVGGNLFTLANPSAVTFPRFNADNTVSALNAADFRTAIGAGTGNGSVTSVGMTVPAFLSVTPASITTSGTFAVSLSGTALPPASGGTGTNTAFTTGSLVFAGASGVYTQNNGNLFWDNANTRLGIGTASPATRLDVVSTFQWRSNTGGTDNINMFSGGTGLAYFGPTTSTNLAVITNGTERMRITSTGDVGIGTVSPGAKLEVARTDAATGIRVTVGSGAYSGNVALFGVTGQSNGYYITKDASNNIQHIWDGTAGAERMRIDSAGQVGIGTTPSAWVSSWRALDVNAGGGALFSGLALSGISNNAYFDSGSNWRYKGSYGAGAVSMGSDGSISILNAGTGTAGNIITFNTRIYVSPTGDVGIGNTAPGQRFSVGSTSASAAGIDQTTTTTTFSVVPSNSAAGGTNITYSWSSGGQGPLRFSNASAEVMRLDASGNLGIGTVSPASRLHSAGITRISDATNSTAVAIDASTTAGVTSIIAQFGGSQLAFGSAATERMRLDASGNLGIGVTGPVARLDVRANNPARGIISLGRNDGSTGQTGSQMQLSQNGVADWAFGQPAGVGDFAFWVGRNPTADGSEVLRLVSTGGITSPSVADAVGYKGLPQNSQTSGYTLALSDMGKHISITTGGVTIPANGSVAFPIGSAVTIFNNSGSNQTISITTDTLRQAGTANTGSRTLAQYGVATVLKVTSTVWVISGAGLS